MARGPFTGASRYKRKRVNGVLNSVHVFRAEQALGKPLPAGAQVHHADGTTDENAPLVICQDAAYHHLLHARTRVVRAGGDPNTQRICSKCRRVVDISGFFKSRSRTLPIQRHCKDCDNARRRALYARKAG